MWIFLDDSGDSGHKFNEGSTRLVTISACVFRTREALDGTRALIDIARTHTSPTGEQFKLTREFKYSKAKDAHKDRFFESIKPAQFSIHSILVNKQKLYSTKLIGDPNSLKSYMIRRLLTSKFTTIQDAKLVIDGEDTRAFGMSDSDYFFNKVNGDKPGTLSAIEWADSKRNDLIQLADMVAGATRKTFEENCPKAHAHRRTFMWRAYPSMGGTHWDFTRG